MTRLVVHEPVKIEAGIARRTFVPEDPQRRAGHRFVGRERIGRVGILVGPLAAPGDRRDEDILEVAKIAAGHFDHYICRRDSNTRGREPGEVPGLLREGLLANGVSVDAIEIIEEEEDANQAALAMARAGDLLLILADNVARSWKQIIYFNSGSRTESHSSKKAAAIDLPQFGQFDIGSDIEIISDERGVRIAREEGD